MRTIAWISPLLPGRQEAWRRVCQIVQELPRQEYDEFRKALGFTNEQVWLAHTLHGDVVLVVLEAERVEQVMAQLAAVDHPLTHWFREQVLELYGLDVTELVAKGRAECLLSWQTLR